MHVGHYNMHLGTHIHMQVSNFREPSPGRGSDFTCPGYLKRKALRNMEDDTL